MSKSIDFGFPKNHIWLRQGLDRWYTRYAENDAGGASNCGFSMEKGTSTGRCFDVFFYSQMDFRCRWFLPESNIVGRLTSETEKSGEIDDQCLRGWPRSPASVLFCCRVLNKNPEHLAVTDMVDTWWHLLFLELCCPCKTQAFPMDKVQNGLGAAKSWVYGTQRQEVYKGGSKISHISS